MLHHAHANIVRVVGLPFRKHKYRKKIKVVDRVAILNIFTYIDICSMHNLTLVCFSTCCMKVVIFIFNLKIIVVDHTQVMVSYRSAKTSNYTLHHY